MHELERNLSFVFSFFFIFLFSFLAAVTTYRDRATEEGRRPTEGCRYHSYVSNQVFGYFPLIVILLFADLLLRDEPDLSILPPLIVMGVFQCVLLTLQPLLRKVITARTCASLWTLLSLTLILLTRMVRIFSNTLLTVPLPFRVSLSLFPWFLYIWLAGFIGILLWHTLRHLLFRRRLLKDAQPAPSPVMHIWAQEEAIANIPVGSYRVMISPAVQTPLSIGLFRRSMVVVLPENEYTPEELKLVLRHELIHICRRDSMSKFSILFLTALFWFNPLMWLAMRCCADDLELSCDETVLYGYESDVRRRYANLLLNTVADQRGFTTCLSASARALRYRLKNVIIPRKRLTGGILIGLTCFLLFCCCFLVNFSYNPGTIEEHVFQEKSLREFVVLDGTVATDHQATHALTEDNPALTEYLSQLSVSPLMREFEFSFEGTIAQIVIDGLDEKHTLFMRDGLLRVYTVSNDNRSYVSYYQLNEPLDWTFLKDAMEVYRHP